MDIKKQFVDVNLANEQFLKLLNKNHQEDGVEFSKKMVPAFVWGGLRCAYSFRNQEKLEQGTSAVEQKLLALSTEMASSFSSVKATLAELRAHMDALTGRVAAVESKEVDARQQVGGLRSTVSSVNVTLMDLAKESLEGAGYLLDLVLFFIC